MARKPAERRLEVAGCNLKATLAGGGFSLSMKLDSFEGGVAVIRLSMSAKKARVPCAMAFEMDASLPDVAFRWDPLNKTCGIPPEWASGFGSGVASSAPVFSLISSESENRLTVAASEAIRGLDFACGVSEYTCRFTVRVGYFNTAEAPLKEYATFIRLDFSRRGFAQSVRNAASWLEKFEENSPAAAPAAAYGAVFSTWYNFHHSVNAKDLEDECRLAAECGLRTVILDDGWQLDDAKASGYSKCGDWKPSRLKFPDMAAHVARVHAIGLKYVVWFSVPFAGWESDLYKAFKGKILYNRDNLCAGVLDPRFPEVREHLIGVYERAMMEWGVDGFKLDFIDSFPNPLIKDPAIDQGYAGRDIKTVPHAVDVLMSEAVARIRKIKPDALIEFRQSYIGPAIRKYGNMLRASDCPYDGIQNRVRTLNLRLTSGKSAVHSDMVEWRLDDSPQFAALQLLNVIFSVPQVSVMLSRIPASHKRMLRNYLGFCEKHKDTLLFGKLDMTHPESAYPVVRATGRHEQIVAVYNANEIARVKLPGTAADRVYIVNSTMAGSLFVEYEGDGSAAGVTRDCFGKVADRLEFGGCKGRHVVELAVPSAGLVCIAKDGKVLED